MFHFKRQMAQRVPMFAVMATLLVISYLVWGCGSQDTTEQANQASQAKRVPSTDIPPVKMATTTSTANTGLLDYLMDAFMAETGIRVDFIATGTGKAIKHGENGDVDVILVHAPPAEKRFVEAGYGVERIPVMWNDFVILGPAGDPASIGRSESASAALAQISFTNAPFISRGDDSGTHKKEKILWEKAGLTPGGEWYIEAGQGMGACLAMANDKLAYILADRGTYLSMIDKIDLTIAFEGDEGLVNPYAIIAVHPDKHSDVNLEGVNILITWFTSPEAQALISDFKVNGKQLFRLFDQ